MQRIVIAFLVLALPALTFAQGNRAGTWEWSLAAVYQDSASSGAAGGSNLRLDNQLGLGFGFGYNFTDKLALSGDFEWLRPDFTATLINENDPNDRQQINHTMSQFNGRMKGTLTFLSSPLSPYVEAGLGWSYFDSNVADGDPIVGCWWHPWWGYICDGFYNTFHSTEFTYGGALGLRYIMRGGMTLKLSVNQYWVDAGNAGGNPELNAARLEVGWTF